MDKNFPYNRFKIAILKLEFIPCICLGLIVKQGKITSACGTSCKMTRNDPNFYAYDWPLQNHDFILSLVYKLLLNEMSYAIPFPTTNKCHVFHGKICCLII